jgi:glycosyltransferase involved in cell wall biosynthesis
LISVIIPVYKDWERLQLCVNALENQSLIREQFELLIINNSVDFPSPPTFQLPTFARILNEPQAGSYVARNRGISDAKGSIIAFTDSDCIPDSSWLEEGLKALNSGADLLAGKISLFKAGEFDSELVFHFDKTFSFNQKRNVETGKCGVTANLFVKKSVIDAIGPFKEDVYSGADTTWTKMAWSRGFSIKYDENTIVSHPSRSHIKDLITKKRRTSGGYFHLEFKNSGPLRKFFILINLLRPPVTVLALKNHSFGNRLKLFFLKWGLEFVGVKELMKLTFSSINPQRA